MSGARAPAPWSCATRPLARALAALEQTDIQPESYDWLRCAHDPVAEC